MDLRRRALDELYFGEVDAESDKELANNFVQTPHFQEIFRGSHRLILGAKGSGKSALFEMFARHPEHVRRLSDGALAKTLFATGTGFKDLTEVSTTDLKSLYQIGNVDLVALWKVYFAVKAAHSLAQQGYTSSGPLKDFSRAARLVKDYRILPTIKTLSKMLLGQSLVGEINITLAPGATAKIGSAGGEIDVIDLLSDVEQTLKTNFKTLWFLFDKLDELFPQDRDQRKQALESLFIAAHDITGIAPSIIPKIFMRTDIYTTLEFPTSSHYLDKDLQLTWTPPLLVRMLTKRAARVKSVHALIGHEHPSFKGRTVDELTDDEALEVFYTLFDRKVYSGQSEAALFDWISARASDASGEVLPREMILYGNFAARIQRERGLPSANTLITGKSVLESYYKVSDARVATFLKEFPSYKEHFKRFRGQPDKDFSRTEIVSIMDGLDPGGTDMLVGLNEVGVLEPVGKHDAADASSFRVPRLYKAGLKLKIHARP